MQEPQIPPGPGRPTGPARRTLIGVRTHRADAESLAAYDRYAGIGGVDITLACDDRQSEVRAGDRRRVGYDADRLARMGLYAHPACGWRCGDYQYYVLRAECPDYDDYWLIEPDVLIHATDLTAFFAAFAGDRADFLAGRYGTRDASWAWHDRMALFAPAVFGCVFPITRLSGRAIDYLLAERQRLSADPAAAAPKPWPNDESFVATALAAGGFACADLNAAGRQVRSAASLRTGVMHDEDEIAKLPADGLIYHPVRRTAGAMADAELRLRVVAEGGRRHDQTRAHLAWLLRLVRTCLDNEPLRGGALPAVIVARQTVTRLDEQMALAAASGAPLAPDPNMARKGQMAHDVFARRYAVGPGGKTLAVAHLATSPRRRDSPGPAAWDDFTLGAALPLSVLPVTNALPYLFDVDGRALLLTLHLWPEIQFLAPSMHVAQRDCAAVAVTLGWDRLGEVYSRVAPPVGLVFVLDPGPDWVAQADSGLRAATRRMVAAPAALAQLARLRGWLMTLDRAMRLDLIGGAVMPFLHAALPGEGASPCVVRLSPAQTLLAPVLAEAFPAAVFACVEGDGAPAPDGDLERRLSLSGRVVARIGRDALEGGALAQALGRWADMRAAAGPG